MMTFTMDVIHNFYMPLAVIVSVISLAVGLSFSEDGLKICAIFLIGFSISTICWLSFFEILLEKGEFYFAEKNYIVAIEETQND